jgi:membrane protease YdiL (CAAX protease family)
MAKDVWRSADGITRERTWPSFIPVTLWVIAAFLLATALAALGIRGLEALGVRFSSIDQTVYTTVAGVVVYAFLLLLVLGAPRVFKRWSGRIGYRKLIGLTRLLQWRDILLAVVGFVIYLALGVAVALILQHFVPGYNSNQAQDTGYGKTLSPHSAWLVLLMLVVVAPVAEEVIFRGYLFGTLRRTIPAWAAILVTSAVFGLVHWQWNVSIDVFVLSLVSCFLRLRTGSLWPSILLHMMKNGLAFYVLYVASSAIL